MLVPGATAAGTTENILGYFKAADAQQREDAPLAGQDTGPATIALWLCCEIALGHHRLPGPVTGRGEDEDRCECQLGAARPDRSAACVGSYILELRSKKLHISAATILRAKLPRLLLR